MHPGPKYSIFVTSIQKEAVSCEERKHVSVPAPAGVPAAARLRGAKRAAAAVKNLVFHQGNKAFHQFKLVPGTRERDLRDHNIFAPAVGRLDLDGGADFNFALARLVNTLKVIAIYNCAARRKIRSRNIFHKFRNRDVRLVHVGGDGVYNFGWVVRRHIGCHADRDAGGTVD